MTIELEHPYEQMAEQLMYAKGASSIQAAIQQALEAQHASLSDEQKSLGLQGMIQAGFDSGISDQSAEEIFEGILHDLRSNSKHSGRKEHAA